MRANRRNKWLYPTFLVQPTMSCSPNMSSRCEVDGQQLRKERGVEAISNDYMVGFLDGFTAASASKDMVLPGRSLPVADEVIGEEAPPLREIPYPGPVQQELDSLPSGGVFTENRVRVSPPSHKNHPRSIQVDNEPSRPFVSPHGSDLSISQYSYQNGLPLLKNWETLPLSNDVANASPRGLSLESPNPRTTPFTIFQPTGPTPETVGSRQNEGSESLLDRSATNKDQPENQFNRYVSPTAGTGVVAQSSDQSGIPKTTNDVNLNGQNVAYRWPAAGTPQQSQSRGVTDLSLAVSKKRAASNVPQTVFRAYGTKRSRFSERSRASTAQTRERGACEVCRKRKIRVS
ncbi:hypothetical protein F5Y04DRAFT_221169 [Hypomontagnella monticulosa]|nr:hypothetical protein F5Y04DRAFT_221169 [Hypomontagnella monticulosa]